MIEMCFVLHSSLSRAVREEASGGDEGKASQLRPLHQKDLHPQEPLQPPGRHAHLRKRERDSQVCAF